MTAAEMSNASDSAPITRNAARVLLIDPSDRVLLIRVGNDDSERGVAPDFPDELWITPGGGLEAGETYEQAALRELLEETGVRDVELGPWVWTRPDRFTIHGVRYEGTERFYVVRTPAIDIRPANPDAGEVAIIREYRWWTVSEIQASIAEFAPTRIRELLPGIIAGNTPSSPIETGF